jgi:hypothetical protein
MKATTVITLTASLALLFGCGKRDKDAPVSSAEIPPAFVEQAINGTPTPIPQARTAFKPGDNVLLSGLVMGVLNPFVEGRAVFVLGDEATITPCDAMPTDHCPTPWDACCDPKQVLAEGTATIQVLDDNGKPAHISLKGMNGLSELSRVTVSGVVAENSTPEAFIVNASAIHIGVR